MNKFTHLANIDISELDLDLKNPRLGQMPDQQGCIYAMLSYKINADKFIELAKTIAEHGILDQRIVVVKENGEDSYTVMDGNRRIAALKILNNPSEAPEKFRPLFKSIADNAATPLTTLVNCEQAVDRETALLDMKLKHSGEQKGAGQIPWGAREIGNFEEMTGEKPRYSAARQICEYLKKQGVKDTDKADITTLERLFTKENLHFLGVECSESEIKFLNDEAKSTRLLAMIINDFASKKYKVKNIYTKEEREDYLKQLLQREASIHQPTTVQSEGANTADPSHTTAAPNNNNAVHTQGQTTYGSGSTQTWNRKRLIPRYTNIRVPKSEAKSYNTYVELKSKLDVRDSPIAVSVLFRLFIEFSVKYYAQKNSIQTNIHLNKLIDKVAQSMASHNLLDSNEAKNFFAGCAAPLIKTQDFNAFVHDTNFQPTTQNLNTAFDNIHKFLALCWR